MLKGENHKFDLEGQMFPEDKQPQLQFVTLKACIYASKNY